MIVTHNASVRRIPFDLAPETEELTLQYTAIQGLQEEDLDVLKRLKSLRSFSFTDNQVSCWDLRRILGVLSESCIYANLSANAALYYQSAFDELMHFPRNLRQLNLSGNNISLFPISSCLQQCPQLQMLWLSDNCLKDLALVADLVHTNLQELVLQHNKFEFPPSCLPNLLQLRALDLSYNHIQSLLNISVNTGLRSLNLQCNKLAYSYAALFTALPPHIEQLNIANNPLLFGLLPQGIPQSLIVTQQCTDAVVEIIPHFYYCSNARNYQLLVANKITSIISVYCVPALHPHYIHALGITHVHRLNCRHPPLFDGDVLPVLANCVKYITIGRSNNNVAIVECTDLLWVYLMASEPAQFATFESARNLLRSKGFSKIEPNSALLAWVQEYTQQEEAAASGCAVC
jgi:hypothetical protein